MPVHEQVAVVTGAAGGLGTALTQAFLNAGYRVAALGRTQGKLEGLAQTLHAPQNRFAGLAVDVLDEKAVQDAAKRVLETFGRVDFLVNVVGGFVGGVPITETTWEQFERMLNLNLKSAFLCCKHFLPAMRKREFGRIVNIGARAGLQGGPDMAAYSASKAALTNLTQSLAAEARAHNVTANVVAPSIIDTAPNRQAMPDADFDTWVKPETLAEIVLFLCSDAAGDISGAVIPVYGRA